MERSGGGTSGLLPAVRDALQMLDAYGDWPERLPPSRRNVALSDLLQQCHQAVRDAERLGAKPVRCLHHFASTGGTLIAKCLAAAPNTVLLSEIDPFSRLQINPGKAAFAPTDLIRLIRYNAIRPVPEPVLGDVLLAGLGVLFRHLTQSGQRLVLRDHAHSHYCHGETIPDRPSLRTLLQRDFQVLSAVTVRHPLDSFLSLSENNWLQHFTPHTLDEYARRYQRFLDDHAGIEILKYEDFTAEPQTQTERLCATLQLPFDAAMLDYIGLFRLTGDSGRTGLKIEKRARRPVPQGIRTEIKAAQAYLALCKRLDYDPDP